jgi:hypothetical protein
VIAGVELVAHGEHTREAGGTGGADDVARRGRQPVCVDDQRSGATTGRPPDSTIARTSAIQS